MILEIVKFGKFLEFYKLNILEIFQIGNFRNYINRTFLKLSKLQILGIFQVRKLKNYQSFKTAKANNISKFYHLENSQIYRIFFFQYGKPKFGPKNW